MNNIKVENLKGIGNMEFHIPSSCGTYIIAGENGIGKTTLLVCMARICNSRAFAEGFASTSFLKTIDQYEKASITYTVDAKSTVFRRKSKRWVPSPKAGAQKRLAEYGFNDVIFVRATSKRIDASIEEIRRGKYERANQNLCGALNRVFETDKFNNLAVLSISNGRGRSSTKIYVMRAEDSTYSEKRFSTGELAVIRLFEYLEDAVEGSLVLIDEAEMALHPRIQRNLYKYLCEVALSKHLYVFLSTHSAVMIQMAKKETIYLLENKGDGIIEVVNPCYPAKAIGCIDYVEMSSFDSLFFVEDDVAAMLLKQMIKRYIALKEEHLTLNYAITPIGGFYETARFAVSTKEKLFSNISVCAVLDADAYDDLDNKPKFKELLSTVERGTIHKLHCTPEVWFIDCIERNDTAIKSDIRDEFHCDISRITTSPEYTSLAHPNQNLRKVAKAKIDHVINRIVANTELDESTARNSLVHLLVKHMDVSLLMRTIGPLLNSNRVI